MIINICLIGIMRLINLNCSITHDVVIFFLSWGALIYMRFLFLFFLVDFLLHVFNSFMVEFILDFMSFKIVVVVNHESVKFLNTLSEVIDWYFAILVVIESEPAVLHDYFHVFVVHSDVVSYLLLVFLEDLYEHWDQISGLVINDIELVLDWWVDFVVHEAIELLTVFYNLFRTFLIVDVLVSVLIRSGWLNLLNSSLSKEKTDVNQFEA